MASKTLLEKLSLIQSRLKAPKLQRNNFGKYNYRSCEDILEAVKPHLAEHGLTLYFEDDIEVRGNRYYVKTYAILQSIDKDSKEEPIKIPGLAREEEEKKGMDASQVTGAASSYARKYALNAMFLIDDTKDSDFTNNGQSQEQPITKASNLDKFKNTLSAITDPEELKSWWGNHSGLHGDAELKKFIVEHGVYLRGLKNGK